MTMIDLNNEDWLRGRTWDMYRGGTLIVTLDDLFWALRVKDASADDQKTELQHFMELPSWRAAPSALVMEAMTFLHESKMKSSRVMRAYSDDEARDDGGRWTSSGGGGGDSTGDPVGERMSPEDAIEPTPSADLKSMNPEQLKAHMADVVARQNFGVDIKTDTRALYDMIEGMIDKYTNERHEQQQKIADSFVNAPGVESDNKLLIMAGLPGSGKSTFLNGSAARADQPAIPGHATALGIDVNSYVVANPDETKAAMQAAGMVPDYSSLGLSKEEYGTMIQEEASAITKMIVAQAAVQGKNIIVDSTMKSTEQFERYTKAIQGAVAEAGSAPYVSTMILIDATKEESLRNATGRYQRGGRFVPLDNIARMPLTGDGRTPPRVTFDNNLQNVDRAILVNHDREIVLDTKPNTPPTTTAGVIASMHSNDLRDPDGGFTLDPETGESPHGTGDGSGKGPYAVAIGDPYSSGAIPATPDQFTPGPDGNSPMDHQIVAFMDANADKLAEPGMHLGGWHAVDKDGKDTGLAYLDVTQVIPPGKNALESAKALGAERDQIAITDLSTFASINTGGTGEKKDE